MTDTRIGWQPPLGGGVGLRGGRQGSAGKEIGEPGGPGYRARSSGQGYRKHHQCGWLSKSGKGWPHSPRIASPPAAWRGL